jgi:hypothetical protein
MRRACERKVARSGYNSSREKGGGPEREGYAGTR